MAGLIAAWVPVAIVSCVGSACTGLVLVMILGHLVSEELASWASTGYMVVVLILCAAVLILWPSQAELEASGVKGDEDSLTLMPWAKILGFLFLTGWMPVLLADRAVEYNIIPASDRESIWLKHILMFLLDLSAFAVWEGATESAGLAGNQPVGGAPIASWAATIFLWLTVSAIVAIYNFTDLLPGAGIPVVEHMGSDLHMVYRVLLILWGCSYVRVIMTPPGGTADCADTLTELSCTDVFYCEACKDRRPHRCHHCNKCSTCVLRMDHHCPWLRRCIGFKNYKFFFVFIAYSAAILSFKATTLIPYTAALFERNAPFGTCFCLLFSETIVGFMALVILAFFSFHIYLVVSAMTTLEFLACGRRTSRRYDYDQGLYKNVQAALGTNPLFWLLPMYPPAGDGASFPYTTHMREPAPRAHPSMPQLPDGPKDPNMTAPNNASYTRLGQEDGSSAASFVTDIRQISRGLSNRLKKTMVQGVDESDDDGEPSVSGDQLDIPEERLLMRPKLTFIHV
mmetsp:Transcript_101396/g.295419  ORF Transcript_101396/g.295419 Transcript_101396/m.295419 type:complete len:512 (+) Transcript_101396:105-1640(+)